MIFKTLLSLASAAFLAATATASSHDALPVQTFDSSEQLSRDLQTINAALYNITFTNAVVNGNDIEVTFANGAGDSTPNGRFEIFTTAGNADGATVRATPQLACFSRGATLFDPGDADSGITVVTNTVASPTSAFTVNFNRDVLKSSPYYYDNNNPLALVITYIFCVKLTLTQSISSTVTDINYREVALAVNVTLDGDLDSVNVFPVNPAAPPADVDNEITYTASADVCNDFNEADVAQGVAIPICIVSDAYPLARIVAVDTLSFTSGALTQAILVSPATAGNAGVPAPGADGLVGLVAAKDPACQLNECIEYQVIVYAIFAPTTSSTTPLQITITGDVVLAIGEDDGTRKLRVNVQPTRELQETIQMQAFRSEITLPALAAPDSAATLTSVCAAAVPFAVAVVAGALAL
mmetsp:Transcript_34753/g.25903  ORF Transcript_34753/g.25903 Transcript_34753/m.25903 type:complete len:410 (+) Transcript_34753:68-1297(+)